MYFQDLVFKLQTYWASKGCVIANPYDVEKGAGTMNPLTFFKVLDNKPWNVAYVEPSRRPNDGRYGDNPNRLYQHHQFQVIMKPSPENIIDLYLESLEAIGFDPKSHDIRFVEDNWESPTLGASGVGWEVWLDGMEVTQFTYFQIVGGKELNPIPVEITYGLERVCMYLQKVENVFDLKWNKAVSYKEIFKKVEFEHSKYAFVDSDSEMLLNMFKECEKEATRVITECKLVRPAYDYVLKCSHIFNLLDARGVISVSERANYIARIRDLAKLCASEYLHACEVENER